MIPENIEIIVDEYKRLRPLLTQLHTEIGGLAKKDAMFACAKRLRMLSRQGGKKTVVFEHELEMDAFKDYLIYMHRPRGINLVQQMLNRNRYPRESTERQLLEGMVQARFSLFMVKSLVPPGGFVAVDTTSGEEFFILDLSLPTQNGVGFLIGCRIFPYRDVWMHSGAVIPIGEVPDVAAFQEAMTEMGTQELTERELNESSIFSWREWIAQMEEED